MQVTRSYYAFVERRHSQRDPYLVLRAIVGTERVAEPKGFDADDLARSIGIHIQDGDEVEITVRVVSRLVPERKPV